MAGNGGGGLRPEVATFLFTDIEGSTRLLERFGDDFAPMFEQHRRVLRDAFAAHDGEEVRTEGDSFFATFGSAADALACAAAIQRGLAAETWPEGGEIRVRIGVHTGEALRSDSDWVGLAVHRAARIMSVGWGGQVVVSRATREVAEPSLAELALRLEDLGERRLKDLTEATQLFQLAGEGLVDAFPALRTLDAVRHNLPVQATSFIGRAEQIAELVELLGHTRILTLTGPGGTGKTRLSLQVAAQAIERFDDGAWFVPLEGVTDPSLVMSAVADALSLSVAGDEPPLEVVIRHLAERRALLVLDNLEQVIDAAPDVAKLVGSCPSTTVLATSRIPLRISGEQEYPVPPLSVPDEPGPGDLMEVGASEAVVLFVARAATILPGFSLNADNAPSVARIARRLDGMPLALELAAARVKLLPVTDIVERLSKRLDLLSSGARDLPDRQRTLRGAIEWSYDLLDEPSRILFERCSVFMGGMDLSLAEQVCGPGLDEDVFEGVAHLVDHSLVRRLPDAVPARFAMYEAIREYAAEQLETRGATNDIRDRHLETFLGLAEQAAPHLIEADANEWLDALEREHDNLRAAIDWAVESGNVADALRLCAAIWRMWQRRGHLLEASRRLTQAVEMPGADEHTRLLAAALEASGGVAYWRGDTARAEEDYERSLELYRQLGDESAEARALYNLSFGAFPDHERVHALGSQALALYEQLGDELGAAKAHWGLSAAAFLSQDWDDMFAHAEASIDAFRGADQHFDLAWAMHMTGLALLAANRDLPDALARIREAVTLFEATQDVTGAYLCALDMALLAEMLGRYEDTIRLHGAVDELRESLGADLLTTHEDVLPRSGVAESSVDEERGRQLRAEGTALSLQELFDYLLSIDPL